MQVGAPGAFAPQAVSTRSTGSEVSASTGMPAASSGDSTARADRPLKPNPTISIDPKLSIVVVAFLDGEGEVRSQIPSERELEAYRKGKSEPDRAMRLAPGTAEPTITGEGDQSAPAAAAGPASAPYIPAASPGPTAVAPPSGIGGESPKPKAIVA